MKIDNPIFYTSKKVIEKLDEFKQEVIKQSNNVLLEQKYKNGVNHREPTNKSLKWILNKCQKEDDVKIVHRPEIYKEKEYFQVVFVKDWYFAWCTMDVEKKDYFINKYDLKKR